MMTTLRRLPVILAVTSALALSACGEKETAPVVDDGAGGQLTGEILERSVTDEMLPLETAGGPTTPQTDAATLQNNEARAEADADADTDTGETQAEAGE